MLPGGRVGHVQGKTASLSAVSMALAAVRCGGWPSLGPLAGDELDGFAVRIDDLALYSGWSMISNADLMKRSTAVAICLAFP